MTRQTAQHDAGPKRASSPAASAGDTTLASFIWKNAEDLWGDFKHTDFGKIILPFTLLRRLECVLEPTREGVLTAHKKWQGKGIDEGPVLRQAAGLPFYNTSRYALATLGATATRSNLEAYVAGFSDNARVIFEQFIFTDTIARLARANSLFRICQNFANTDLHPDVVPDRVMSNIYEHLIRRFGAAVNEAAEDFMTPRDVVHLATTLWLDPDDDLFRNRAIASLKAARAFARLDDEEQAGWIKLLQAHLGETHPYTWLARLPAQAKKAGLGEPGKPLVKAMEDALGVRDPDAPAVQVDGEPVADRQLEDFENVPLGTDVYAYMEREVLPHVPDAWIDPDYRDERDGELGKVGYEINFNRYFYKYVPPRDLHDIDAELKAVEAEIAALLGEVAE